ncbi:MAG: T9SS type A sorting domain-containing protein [Bacteroidota bacterium]
MNFGGQAFNPTTTISFSLPENALNELKIFNVLGEEAATLISAQLSPGIYNVTFDGEGLSSGVYYYSLIWGDSRITRKFVLLK